MSKWIREFHTGSRGKDRFGGSSEMNKNKVATALLAAAAIGLAFPPAHAADMPIRAARAAPARPHPPVPSWGGWYIGGNGGWYEAIQTAQAIGVPTPGFGAPNVAIGGLQGLGVSPTGYRLDQSGGFGGI